MAAPSRFRDMLIGHASRVADECNLSPKELVETQPDFSRTEIKKGLVIKPKISDNEPGVVFISFEEQWARLLNASNLDNFSRDYTLVVSPTWSPPHTSFNYMFPRLYPKPVFTLISNTDDLEFFPCMSDNYLPIELYASSWVHPDIFKPAENQVKDLDIVVISNFSKYKRHFELFKALKKIPRTINVTLVGQPNAGRTADDLLREAEYYGVRDRITLKVKVSNEELINIVARAKVSLILSMREGSCVAVVESMFANTPVGLFEDAGIGSKAFINKHTGCLLPHKGLANALTAFIRNSSSYSPRDWVMENNVSCFNSSQTLNKALKKHALANNEEWTRDIAPFYWHPDPALVHDQDNERFKTEIRRIESDFLLKFE